MKNLLPILLSLLLGACDPGSGPGKDSEETGDDTGDTDSGLDTDSGQDSDSGLEATELAVGELVDMTATEAGVALNLAQAGTYVAMLVSTSSEQDETYGYASLAGARWLNPIAALLPIAPPFVEPPGLEPVEVGDLREFTVSNGSRNLTIQAQAIQVTAEIVLWSDITTKNEKGEIDAKTVATVLDSVENIVLPRERQLFGQESDVDGDGKIAVLLSYTVNQYGAMAYVSWCDIGSIRGCGEDSNHGEIIYMGIPDPESTRSSANGIVETIAHEFAHLIYAYHKFILLDQTDAIENVYVTEGMSALAQDLTGYNNGNQYVWGAALDMSSWYDDDRNYSIDGVSLNDIVLGGGSYDRTRDGTLRGAAYLFLRYLFEQAGGVEVSKEGAFTDLGGIAWLHDWFDSPELGEDAVVATTGRTLTEAMLDWYTAILVTGRDLNDNPLWNYQDRVVDPLTGYSFGVDPFAALYGGMRLTGPLIQEIDQADGSIRGGGVEYLQFTTEGGLVEIPVTAQAMVVGRLFRIE